MLQVLSTITWLLVLENSLLTRVLRQFPSCLTSKSWFFVSFQEAQAYAEENSLLFMETSAKTAMNVNDIFLAIGKSLFWCLYHLTCTCTYATYFVVSFCNVTYRTTFSNKFTFSC